MDVKQLLGAISAMVIKIAIAAVVIIAVFKGAVAAYDFGFQVFADIPIAEGEGRTVSVIISENQDSMDIGALLESKGLIKNKYLFYVQEMLSDYKDMIQPGVYELSTAMSVADMLEVMCNVEEEEQ